MFNRGSSRASLSGRWRLRRIFGGVILAAAATAVGTGPAFGIVPVQIVALTDEQAPGMPQGVIFDELGWPDINAAGHTAFTAVFAGPGVIQTNDRTLWSDRSGMLAQVAREGAQAPDLPMMVVYEHFGTPILNDAGRLAFEAHLSGIGVSFDNDEAVFSEGASGVLGLVTREGTQAAGTPANVNHSGINPPVFNNDGRVLFSGGLTGPGVDFSNNVGIWTGYPGSVQLVAREANQAPDLPAGVTIEYGSSDIEPVLGGTNQCVFFAGLDGVGVNTGNDNVIYAGPVGVSTVVVREGEPAPGAPGGVNIGVLLKPATNESGATAFQAFLTGAVDPSNDRAIFSEGSSGMLDLLARKGDQAPGAAQGVLFSYLYQPLLCADGSAAFQGQLTGTGVDDTNDEFIGSDNTGALGFVAREGDEAPGAGADVVFAGDAVAMQPAFGAMAMNGIGQMVFQARVEGPGVDATNNMGIWQHDPVVGLRLIVRHGDSIEVAPGDSRIVQNVYFAYGSGGSDGRACPLNDTGQFAFWAWFTDGSQGVFVTTDSDGDGTVDAFDNCPATLNGGQEDADGDGVGDACDDCPDDAGKIESGACGCGVADNDTDGDGIPDCFDICPNNPANVDANSDGICDNDNAPSDGEGSDTPEMQECCGGGVPMLMPFMLIGWAGIRRRGTRLGNSPGVRRASPARRRRSRTRRERARVAHSFFALAALAGLSSTPALAVAPPPPPGCPGTTTRFENNDAVPIPAGPGLITSVINVSGLEGLVWDVDVQTFITHDFPLDLDVTLTTPTGFIFTLTTDNGHVDPNVFNGVIWDDQADPGGQVPYTHNPNLVTDRDYAGTPPPERLVPEEPLSTLFFVAETGNGPWTLTISDDKPLDDGMLDGWALDITSIPDTLVGDGSDMGPAQLPEFENTAPQSISSVGPNVVQSTVSVGTLGGAVGEHLCLLSVDTNITHTNNADLDITLQSPQGTVVTLSSDNGSIYDDVFAGTSWADFRNLLDGALPYMSNDGLATDHAYMNQTVATDLAPEESLAAFHGENPLGVWILTISDDKAGDGGMLNSWKLTVFTCRREDLDADGVGDGCDNCVDDANADQADADGDGLGDACDECFGDNASGDDDSDGVCNDLDECAAGDDAADADTDGTPDACDEAPTGECCGGGLPVVLPLLMIAARWRRRTAH